MSGSTNAAIFRTASNSYISSKSQTPIKSPSPDQARMNALTPTKVKYLGENKNIKYQQAFASQNIIKSSQVVSEHHFYEYQSYQYTPDKMGRDININKSQKKYDGNAEHIRHLQQQVQILQIQNKNLLRKLAMEKQKQKQLAGFTPLSYSASQSKSKHDRDSLAGEQPRRHTTSQIIAKIKEQYEENINTLKMMIQQEIKEAFGVVQDMCQVLNKKIINLEQRIQNSETKISSIKLQRIISMTQKKDRQGTIKSNKSKGSPTKSENMSINGNSFSDILCLSIPQQQQQQQQSKQDQLPSQLQMQIQQLKQTIADTHQHYRQQHEQYRHEHEQLILQLQQKSYQIQQLSNNLQKSQKEKYQIQHRYGACIRGQLQLLQVNVRELGDELASRADQFDQLMLLYQQKCAQAAQFQQSLKHTTDQREQMHRRAIGLEEKVRFLQANVVLLEKQLKERKKMLDQTLLAKSLLQKQRISRISSQASKLSAERNVMTLTSRIDKLMVLESQRQREEKQILQFRHSLQKIVNDNGERDKNELQNSQI